MANRINPVLAGAVAALSFVAGLAWAQSNGLLRWFGPATGVLVGTAGNPQTRAAVASDIETLISPLPVANGGTGHTTLAAANIPTISGTPVSGNCVNWATSSTLGDTGSPCGSGGGGGSVSSVGLSMPAEFSVSGTPVTSSGTLAVTRVAGAATIAFSTSPSSVNLTTEGTLDWLIMGNGSLPDLTNNFINSGGGRKQSGGLQIYGIGPAGSTTLSTGGSWSTPAWNASANDTRAQTGSIVSYTQTLAFVPGANNTGFVFRLPCDPFQRVARVYDSNGSAYHVTLTSSDGSLSVDSGSHTPSTNEQVTITYTCKFPGATVSVFVGDTGSTTGNVSIGGVTLGSV